MLFAVDRGVIARTFWAVVGEAAWPSACTLFVEVDAETTWDKETKVLPGSKGLVEPGPLLMCWVSFIVILAKEVDVLYDQWTVP